MSDWKWVPAISTNAFAVAPLVNGLIRVAFGEGIEKGEEPSFHGALLMDQEAAQLLIDLLGKALEPPESGSGEGGKGGGGRTKVILGSTSVH